MFIRSWGSTGYLQNIFYYHKDLDDHVLDALHQLDRVNVVRLQVLEKGTERPFVALI